MKNDLVKSLKLARYSLSKRMNVGMMILFFVVGLLMELWESAYPMPYEGFLGLHAGAIFLLSTSMFPAQMLVSTDVSSFVQTSPYKKRLQTSMTAKLQLVSVLAIFTLILGIRLIGIALSPQRTMESLHILSVGMFAALILVYCGFVYKFFIASVVLLYVIVMASGFVYGFAEGIGQPVSMQNLTLGNPAADIALSYALIIAAVGLEYLISLAVYKFPLSKFAFRCSRGMSM